MFIICNEDGSQNTYLDESIVECIQQSTSGPLVIFFMIMVDRETMVKGK